MAGLLPAVLDLYASNPICLSPVFVFQKIEGGFWDCCLGICTMKGQEDVQNNC